MLKMFPSSLTKMKSSYMPSKMWSSPYNQWNLVVEINGCEINLSKLDTGVLVVKYSFHYGYFLCEIGKVSDIVLNKASGRIRLDHESHVLWDLSGVTLAKEFKSYWNHILLAKDIKRAYNLSDILSGFHWKRLTIH